MEIYDMPGSDRVDPVSYVLFRFGPSFWVSRNRSRWKALQKRILAFSQALAHLLQWRSSGFSHCCLVRLRKGCSCTPKSINHINQCQFTWMNKCLFLKQVCKYRHGWWQISWSFCLHMLFFLDIIVEIARHCLKLIVCYSESGHFQKGSSILVTNFWALC